MAIDRRGSFEHDSLHTILFRVRASFSAYPSQRWLEGGYAKPRHSAYEAR